VVLELYIKFGSNIAYFHWDRHTYAPEVHLMTPRELTIGFDFWSRDHLRVAVTLLPTNFGIWSYWHFSEIQMAAAVRLRVILDFQIMWIWPFRRVDILLFVFYTKFGSNIYCSHRDRRTYASDVHLMTSRELTFDFNFWSRGHLRMAMVHLPIIFGADMFIQSRVIDIFPKLKMAAAAILDLLMGAMGPSTKAN